MKTQQSFMPGKVLIDKNTISRRVDEIAQEIANEYKGQDLVMLALLRGSFVFLADLIRSLFEHSMPLTVDFISVSSYGDSVVSSGSAVIEHSHKLKLKGRQVIIVDDILDTGTTLAAVKEHLLKEEPACIKTCVLLDKPARRNLPVTADIIGFTVENVFVVGYGLDYDDDYRYLPHIAELDGTKSND
ncbi:MAG: hypoxanthine phosphoribosyltransferase [Lentisphaerae bacterium]|nr:hypoxanthine phosphoribosyltransferase [Lentisphaerota bacterium]